MRVVDTGTGVDFETPQGKIYLVYKKTDADQMVTFTMTQEALADLINLANTGFPAPMVMQPTGFVPGVPATPVAGAETTVTTTTVKRL